MLLDIGPLSAASGHPLRTLVTLDGSALSEAVLELVAQLVAALSAPSQGALHLLRIVNVSATRGAWRSQANIGSEMSEHMKQEAKAYLTSVVDRLQENAALDYMHELIEAELTITASVVTDADVAGAII